MNAILLDGHRVIVLGIEHALVESRTRTNQWHAIELVDEGRGYLTEHCTCEAFTHKHENQELPCWHARLIRDWRLGKCDQRLDVAA